MKLISGIYFLQGQIIIHKLRKEQVLEHAVKIREQLNVLEQFLTQHKFIATDYVRCKLNRFRINVRY